MALFVKLGSAVLGVVTLGSLTLSLKPDNTAIAPLIGATPVQSNIAQISEPADDSQTESTGSLSESALRDAAQRRLAAALMPREGSEQNPVTSPSSASIQTASATGGRTIGAPAATAVAVDEAEMHRLASRAEQSIGDGDIIGARLLLERAIRAGDGKALFMLAETYDPQALSRLRVQGIVGDADLARNYYNRALSAGVGEARERLSALAQ